MFLRKIAITNATSPNKSKMWNNCPVGLNTKNMSTHPSTNITEMIYNKLLNIIAHVLPVVKLRLIPNKWK